MKDIELRCFPDRFESVPPTPRTAELCVLASGSRGNSVYVSDGNNAILIDAGLSGREIDRRLRSRGLSPSSLRAIVVSHEHSDHIQGVGVLSRRWRLPVYINRKTAAGASIGRLHQCLHFECGTAFQIGSFRIHPFSLSHDAADPSGFTIGASGWKIGIATDLGCATAMVRHHLADCRALVLEANHDPEMLLQGPYPWPLKQRIRARTGHLSNADSGALLGELSHPGLRQVVLAHLSETNNTPEKAFQTVAPFLENHLVRLSVAVQNRCGERIQFE